MSLRFWFAPWIDRGVVAKTALVALAACLVACSCSGGASSSPASGRASQEAAKPADGRAQSRQQRALERLRARQQAACERVSTVITDCAVAEARATLSPEELAELDLQNTAPRHRATFMEQCVTSDMSLRQVEVFENCLADTACDVFVECLDQARPRP